MTTEHRNAFSGFHPRRFTDPVSPLNDEIYDATHTLTLAVEMLDRLGLHILSVEAERSRNKRIHVSYGAECAALGGAETSRDVEWSHWTANTCGVEIRWCIPTQEAA